jgi:LmbE family N-acetylglucosaminyl deacetylase
MNESSVAFYVGAHQDDWQLFMSPQAYTDLVADGSKVVFIYTTAGDAGGHAGWWQGRRAGALSSIQFALHQPIAALTPELSQVNQHPIPCYSIANTRSYFLGLPDGNKDGSGFPATGNQSLQKLQQASGGPIAALCEQAQFQTQYHSWQDLVATVKAIINLENADASLAPSWVHILDPRVSEHSDHKYTGILVQDALSGDPRYSLAMYEEYMIPSMAPNVEGLDLVRKAGLYLFYAQTALEWSGSVEQLDDWHLSFIPRQYRTQ